MSSRPPAWGWHLRMTASLLLVLDLELQALVLERQVLSQSWSWNWSRNRSGNWSCRWSRSSPSWWPLVYVLFGQFPFHPSAGSAAAGHSFSATPAYAPPSPATATELPSQTPQAELLPPQGSAAHHPGAPPSCLVFLGQSVALQP